MLNDKADAGVAQKIGAIDVTPTWGEIGLLFWRLAMSGERAAVQEMRGEVARAFCWHGGAVAAPEHSDARAACGV